MLKLMMFTALIANPYEDFMLRDTWSEFRTRQEMLYQQEQMRRNEFEQLQEMRRLNMQLQLEFLENDR